MVIRSKSYRCGVGKVKIDRAISWPIPQSCFPEVTALNYFFFFLFRAALVAYGGSQARSQIASYSWQLTPQTQQCKIQTASATYTTAHDNARSLTHWWKPGNEPAFFWILMWFITTEPQWKLWIIRTFLKGFILYNLERPMLRFLISRKFVLILLSFFGIFNTKPLHVYS